MNVLVTGGSGFVGSNLVRWLLARRPEARVVNLDALTYAANPDHLDGLESHARYTFVHGDVCDARLVVELMEGTDLVLHLAAESHVDRSIVSDAPFVRTNVLGTQTLLAAALEAGVGRFVQVSTDEVYGELPWRDPALGDRSVRKFTEDAPLAPRSPYSATKAAGDHLALAYHTTHRLDVVVTRSSNNHGPYQLPEKLIPLVITHALDGRPCPVYGDGLHVRDWMHVADHCEAIVAAAERGRAGRVYNFGGDAERTNLSVVRQILRMLGRPEDLIEHVTDRPGHDRRYAIDFGRAQAELGWRPARTFDDALTDTVRWYVEHESWWRRDGASGALKPSHPLSS